MFALKLDFLGGRDLKIFLQEFQELNKAASVGGGGGREVACPKWAEQAPVLVGSALLLCPA